MIVDRLAGLTIAIIAAILYVITMSFPREAALYPRGILVLIFCLSIVLLIKPKIKRTIKGADLYKNLWHNPTTFLIGAITFVFILLMETIGFYILLPLFTGISMFILGPRNFKIIIIFSISLTLFVYIVFNIVLRVPVPMGWLN